MTIHSLFSEKELQKRLNTVDKLLQQEEIIKFVEWVKNKPAEFYVRSKHSRERRSKKK